MAAGTKFTVQILLKAKNLMSGQALKAGKAVKSIGDEFKKMGRSMEFAEAKQILLTAAVKAYQALKTGAAINQQKAALDGLARTYGSTGAAITESMQKASNYTIDRMSAVEAANKAMILDVAKSPAEFARLAKVATVLGNAMGQDATKSIDDFVVAAGRQSKMIADNLGLMVSSADANKRWAEANNTSVASMDDAQKKQAFLTEMLRQGEAKMLDMGEQTESTAVKMAQMETSAKDAGNELLSLAATLAKNQRGFKNVNEAMKIAAGLASQLNIIVTELATRKEREAAAVLETSKAYDKHLIKTRNVVQATKDYKTATSEAIKAAAASVSNVDNYGDSLEELTSDLDIATGSTIKYIQEQKALAVEQKRIAQETNEAALSMGMAWTEYFADRAEQRTENVKTIRDIESEHQANMAEIQKKGQAKAVWLNASAEESKLATLKQKLAMALLQQSEFTEKTKESTQIRKEQQIAGLQSQIGSQTTLLDNYYNGRLITQGENITAEVAAENSRYEQERIVAQEARALQEEEMRQSMGRMMIQQFETWATIRGIPAEEMLKMKNQMAVDYGLMTQEGQTAANANIDIWEGWAENMSVPTGAVVAQMMAVTDAVNAIPDRKIDIEINVRKTGYGGTLGEGSAEEAAATAVTGDQSGGMGGAGGRGFAGGANFTVPKGYPNDTFPMRVSSGERVIVIPKGGDTTTNYNMSVSTRATSPAVQSDFGIMKSMNQRR